MPEPAAYSPRKPPRSRFLSVRGLNTHVREWGPPGAPPLVLLHGSRDGSATFQFMVDEFSRDFHFIAPDMRGYGHTQWSPGGYWFQDFLADLDIFLDMVLPGLAIALIGHSLGGMVAGVYAGVRPARVAKLVALDAFGLPDSDPTQTPDRLARWIDTWRAAPQPSRPYNSLAEMAERLRKANGLLSGDKALFLAAQMSRRRADGAYEWSFDPLHRAPFAIAHRKAEWEACMRRITAPALWLASGRRSQIDAEPGGLAARAALLGNVALEKIEGTSHNLHHDKPAEVARIVEAFVA